MEDMKRVKSLKMGKPESVGSFDNALIKPYLEENYTETKNTGSFASTLFGVNFWYLNAAVARNNCMLFK